MKLFPAIDLIDAQAVRLEKGDYSRKTVYSGDPVKTAISFASSGAEYLHVVDLDGAKSGERVNESVIRRIISETPLNVEVGCDRREFCEGNVQQIRRQNRRGSGHKRR